MASKVQQEKPLESMMKNLKVDNSSEVGKNNKAVPRAGNPGDATAFGPRPGGVMNGGRSDAGKDYLAPEQGNYYPMNGYYGYYYPGFDGSFGESDEQGYYFGPEGLEMQYPVVQGDNGQLLYYTPEFHFGYDAYGSFVPGAMVGMDGQYMTQQPFFPGAVVQQPLSPQVFSPSPVAYGADMYPAYTWETSPLAVDASSGNGLAGGIPVSVPKSNLPSSVHTLAAAKTAAPLKTNNSVNKDTKQLVDVPSNQPNKAADKISQQASTLPASTALAKGYFPIAKFPEKPGLHYAGGNINAKAGGQTWIGPGKLKGRNRVNGLTGFDWLNEQNRGPRTTGPKNPLTSNGDSAGLDGIANSVASVIRSDQFNLPDFQTKHDHAMFYVIKSYSEDDVHKSIKYSVWASTPNGNKRLDNAYEEAQMKVEEKGSKCPVFLFFSVNASGQFCGVAEMTGRVDFDKSMDFWQQDKWTGFFPVNWHIIKDVPNTQFRHIILENNDNKPVTNSRDTQEVKFFQGIEMLNIFKNYSAKTSIIDDFGFYESRQKIMQDKKIRPAAIYPDHFQKKFGDVLQVPQFGDIKNDSSHPADNLTTVKKDPEVILASVEKDVDLNGEVEE